MGLIDRRDFLLGTAAATVLICSDVAPAAGYVNEEITGPGYVVPGTRWLMGNIGDALRKRVKNTPFSVALLCAMAYQESGYFWWRRKFLANKSIDQVLRLIVLDDVAPRARAFPRDTAAFLADRRFAKLAPTLIAASDAARIEQGGSATGKLRFGYGLFQNDLQNILTYPEFWSSSPPGSDGGVVGLWGNADACIDYCLRELAGKYASVRDVHRAVRNYNGNSRSADIYLENVKIYEKAIIDSGAAA
jgi:hypothetical protein